MVPWRGVEFSVTIYTLFSTIITSHHYTFAASLSLAWRKWEQFSVDIGDELQQQQHPVFYFRSPLADVTDVQCKVLLHVRHF